MQAIYQKIPQLIARGEVGAYCTVVDTSGSTPQKPGAKLLILPSLENIGTLGGGCVEAEARQQAIDSISKGGSHLLEFQLDNDYGWDDGLICGGQMKIFIDLPKTQTEYDLFTTLQDLYDQKIPLFVATIVESNVDSLVIGQKRLVSNSGQIVSNFSAPNLASQVDKIGADVLQSNVPKLCSLDFDQSEVIVFVEPIQPRPTLLIAGAGHIGQALCHLGNWIDFDVVVVDDRADLASYQYLPDSHQVIVGDIATELGRYPIDELTYVVIVTRGHNHDEEALHAVVNSNARYIGLIGSRRKIKLIFDDLVELGVSTDRLNKVFAPIGLDISSKTVPEIAVSIASQLIQVRNTHLLSKHSHQPKPMPTVKAVG